MDAIGPTSAARAIADVQRRLGQLGIQIDDPQGTWGSATDRGLRLFQQIRGLVSDGLVGEDTWRELVSSSYKLGDRLLYRSEPTQHGDDVRDLQRRLGRLGFDSGPVDGEFSDAVDAALREFQLNVGLPPDGVVGRDTVDRLYAMHRGHQTATVGLVRERQRLRTVPARMLGQSKIFLDPDPSENAGSDAPSVTWGIAHQTAAVLRARGANVVMSRGPSTTPPSAQRAALANRSGVDVILSIRLASSSPDAQGATAWFFGAGDDISVEGHELATRLLNGALEVTGGPDCRAHPSTRTILRHSRAPAAVIEPGYWSNKEDRRVLQDQRAWVQFGHRFADAVAHHLARTPL